MLTIFTYEVGSKQKNMYRILLVRKNSSNNFSFFETQQNKKQIKIEKKTSLILEIGVSDKEKNIKNGHNLYLSLNKKIKEGKVFKREVIDLRQYYLFTEEVKFKDLK